jgi:hypothetical protein
MPEVAPVITATLSLSFPTVPRPPRKCSLFNAPTDVDILYLAVH